MTLHRSHGPGPRAVLLACLLASLLAAGCSQPDSGKGDAAAGPSTTAPASSPPTASSSPAAPAPAPTTPAPPPERIEVSVEGLYPANPSFSPAEATVHAGASVTLHYTNNDLNPLGSHNWFLDGVGMVAQEIGQGESSDSVFVAPPPGDYAYYCSLQGHREAGMEGVLHVLPAGA